ncbi:unnamed protein product [Rhodiola kirilowii]
MTFLQLEAEPLCIYLNHQIINIKPVLVFCKMTMPLRMLGMMFGCLMMQILAGEAARVRTFKWAVKYEYKSPDCYKKVVITINGRTPGPTIVAQQGDTVVVELKNSLLTENVAIHWHGIRQIGTPWSDGTEGVTQCPILPGDTFVHKFVVDRVSLGLGQFDAC